MNFMLTEEQLKFQKMMREFAEKEVAPGAIERDESEDFEATYDILMNKIAKLGLFGINFPKEYGGMGLTAVELALGLMEICRVDVSVGASWSVCQSLGSVPIYNHGTEEQKQK